MVHSGFGPLTSLILLMLNIFILSIMDTTHTSQVIGSLTTVLFLYMICVPESYIQLHISWSLLVVRCLQ